MEWLIIFALTLPVTLVWKKEIYQVFVRFQTSQAQKKEQKRLQKEASERITVLVIQYGDPREVLRKETLTEAEKAVLQKYF